MIKDELTEVLNRKGVNEKLASFFKEILFAKEHPNFQRKFQIGNLSIIFVDIDDFKKVNDSFGHSVGDFVLKRVSSLLSKNLRCMDMVGRLGGEEFAIVLIGASEEESYRKAEEIRKRIQEENFEINSFKIKVTASLGVASLKNTNSHDFRDLIDLADKAMYEAKTKRGKNNTVKYSELK